LFVGLTIVKAFYIVGEFMHLKHEVKSLIWSILIPCIFVVWLLLALMLEGGSIFSAR
ncbi:MAG: cytochrome C oxidase subunit IV family protein, partial [Bacteroidetes bacterium]|nr:cytochrome C oxidase subunit IV family protein [Bacteroidota bacterium]